VGATSQTGIASSTASSTPGIGIDGSNIGGQ
jgi:hypothetical protein